MFQGNYKGASAKFRDAADRAPEAKYFFNLCTSLYEQGMFGEALTACNYADKLNPDDKLKGKLGKLEDKIKSDAAAQHIDLQPTGGGGGPTNVDANAARHATTDNPTTAAPPHIPTTGNGGTGELRISRRRTGDDRRRRRAAAYAVGRPSQDIMAVSRPSTITPGRSASTSSAAAAGSVARTSTAARRRFRVKGDYMLIPPATSSAARSTSSISTSAQGDIRCERGGATLDIIDVGVAAYKHLCFAASIGCA